MERRGGDTIKLIKLKQIVAIIATFVAMFAFVLLAIRPLIANPPPATPILWLALGSFMFAVVALIAHATAKCPRCKKEFAGDSSDGGGPAPKSFASTCQYCGYPHDAQSHVEHPKNKRPGRRASGSLD